MVTDTNDYAGVIVGTNTQTHTLASHLSYLVTRASTTIFFGYSFPHEASALQATGRKAKLMLQQSGYFYNNYI